MSVYVFNLILRERGNRNLKCILQDPFDDMLVNRLRSKEREMRLGSGDGDSRHEVVAVGGGMERRDNQSETRKIWWWGVVRKRAAEVFLCGGVWKKKALIWRGEGVKNPDGIIKKQKEILYFLLCLVSQFPVLE